MEKKCPHCGTPTTKITLKDKLIGAVAKTVVFVDPAPTTGTGKELKGLLQNVYRCPNCGHEWTEQNRN